MDDHGWIRQLEGIHVVTKRTSDSKTIGVSLAVFTPRATTSGASSPVSRQNTAAALSINASVPRLATNADELAIGAKIPAPLDQRRGGQRSSVEMVDAEKLELRPGGEDESLAVVIGEEDLAADRDR